MVIVVSALFWFLQKTRTGKAMRAYSDNEDLALLSGINPDRVVMITWILAAALATIAGTLYGLDKSFKPFTYFQLLLPIFAAAIVGGIGQPLGAIAGGFMVAFSEVTVTYAYKQFLDLSGARGPGRPTASCSCCRPTTSSRSPSSSW
jgi:branched-chain amino acid transport system permease protein